MTTRQLDPVLARQLRRAKLDPDAGPVDRQQWAQLLDSINEHYLHSTEDRALLNRSLELSTTEQEGLRRAVELQRDRLSSIIGTIGQSLSEFGALAQTDTGQLRTLQADFTRRLRALLADYPLDGGSLATTDVSQVRTNLLRLADQLVVLVTETAERAVLKKELEVARAVQSLLVPADDVVERPSLQAVGYFQPAAETGGDWWTVADLAQDRILLVIGDVTGHGVSAAIITGAAKAACDLAIEMTAGALTAGELMVLMNSTLVRTGRQRLLMSCLIAVFDPGNATLTIANAGHPNPFLIRQGVIHPLMAQGSPLGATNEASFTPIQVQIEAGDLLACFTDGMIEAENSQGEQFSERRMRAVAQRAAGLGARGVRDAVVAALDGFLAGGQAADDLTFVTASFR
jgi:sigma-B regulation protein RsbU (phosphoserine phosphatase)